MPKKLFVLVSLVLLMLAPAVLSRPPEGPSFRLVQDQVATLKAEVQRLEKEVASDESLAENLAMAHARLLAAEGSTTAARAAWNKIVAAREEWASRLEPFREGHEAVILRGYVAVARCGLAEVEKDRVTLARELPKLIVSYETHLEIIDALRKHGDYDPRKAEEEERAIHKELREARQRLDAVKRK